MESTASAICLFDVSRGAQAEARACRRSGALTQSEDPNTLSVEFRLHLPNVDLMKIGFRFQRQGRCNTCTLSRNRTTAHVTYGGMADTITTDGTTRDEQVLYFLREQTAIGDLEIASRGWQNQIP